jgi:trans-aconitate 2-methyltransferase
MTTWDAQTYLRFGDERTQPSRDLAARVALDAPQRIIDLGCGPGNSTAVLRARWPAAALTGLDSSEAMLAQARADYPEGEWVLGDVATWRAEKPYDLVFANAVLHWLPDHATLYPQLLAQVAPGGALAVQIPTNYDSPIHHAIFAVAADVAWAARTARARAALTRETAGFYYDLLRPQATRIDLWETTYYHLLDDALAIVDWTRGTGLRPFLQALADDAERRHFEELVRARIVPAYPPQADGRVLFPFRRLFLVAYR